MNELDALAEGYLAYLRAVGRKTPRTVIDVRCTLRRASRGLEALRPDTPAWKCQLEDVLHWFEREREAGCSPSSLAKFVSHMRGLLDYAWRSGRIDRNVLDGFSLNDAQVAVEPRSLTLDEAATLVNACRAKNAPERRDRLMVLLLYGCGLRNAELCALDVPDVVRERQELLVRNGKNGRPRVVPIPHGVYTELLAYLLELCRRGGALFKTRAHKRRIRTKDVCDVVAAAARGAHLTGIVTPKALRHSFATHLMDRGVDLAIIASLMGHRSPRETGVYLHVLPGKREAAVRTLTIGGAQ
jgi:integrase/recombinase XerD